MAYAVSEEWVLLRILRIMLKDVRKAQKCHTKSRRGRLGRGWAGVAGICGEVEMTLEALRSTFDTSDILDDSLIYSLYCR